MLHFSRLGCDTYQVDVQWSVESFFGVTTGTDTVGLIKRRDGGVWSVSVFGFEGGFLSDDFESLEDAKLFCKECVELDGVEMG